MWFEDLLLFIFCDGKKRVGVGISMISYFVI